MLEYLEWCRWITPYLVATLGVLVLVLLAGCVLALISVVWYYALCEFAKRFQVSVKNAGAWEDYRRYRQQELQRRQRNSP